jgi:hypothetical protein
MSRSRERSPAVGVSPDSSVASRIIGHFRGNTVAYVALFTALGGTSYAAVNLKPGSVRSAALARGAVTHPKLAAHSINQRNLVNHSLSATAFKSGTLKSLNGARGPGGPAGPAGQDGSASIVMKARQKGSVTAPHGAATTIPLSSASWTQGSKDLNILAGSVTIKVPSACTGSFGNSVLVSVDGTLSTFGLAPTFPASSTITVPIAVGELMEPGGSKSHQISAKLANTCSKSGEDYTVSGAKLDVLSFH